MRGTQSHPNYLFFPFNTSRKSTQCGRRFCKKGNSVCCTSGNYILFRLRTRKHICSQVSYTITRLSTFLMHFWARNWRTFWIRAYQECVQCHSGRWDVNSLVLDSWLGTCYCWSENWRTRRGTLHGKRVHTTPTELLRFKSASLSKLSTWIFPMPSSRWLVSSLWK